MLCIDKNCPKAVKQADTGRWYITNGHPGFTHKQNLRSGFKSQESALEVFHGSIYYGLRYGTFRSKSLNDIASGRG